jgi:hypothetical protein
VVYKEQDRNELVLKIHVFFDETGKALIDNNKEEWSNYRNLPAVTAMVPKVFGYIKSHIDGRAASFIFVERVAYTFKDVMDKKFDMQTSFSALRLVAQLIEMVVKLMMQCVRDGITPYDWHLDNIGIEEDGDTKIVKLIDWQGNNVALDPDSLQQRMDKAFRQFAERIAPWKRDFCMSAWSDVFSSMRTVLEGWWDLWSSTDHGVEDLPSQGNMTQLKDS